MRDGAGVTGCPPGPLRAKGRRAGGRRAGRFPLAEVKEACVVSRSGAGAGCPRPSGTAGAGEGTGKPGAEGLEAR